VPSQYVVVQDCIGYDLLGIDNMAMVDVKPQNWTSGGYVVVARNVSHTNLKVGYPLTHAAQDNAGGFYFYSDVGTSDNYLWFLNNKAYNCGDGIKCKHSGSVRAIIQGNEFCNNGRNGAHVGGVNTVFRKNVCINNYTYHFVSNSDGGPEGPMLVDGNTFVITQARSPYYWGINNQGTSHALTGSHFVNNIVYDSVNSSGTLFGLWLYQTDWSAYRFDIDYNLYYNNPDAGGFIVGGGSPDGTISFAQWKTKAMLGGYTPDAHSLKTDPLFENPTAGILNITSASPAATASETGSYVGALAPDKSYGTFGVNNTTLIDMQITGAYTPPPEPEPLPDGVGFFGAIYYWGTFR
jgi:hypothetical protein